MDFPHPNLLIKRNLLFSPGWVLSKGEWAKNTWTTEANPLLPRHSISAAGRSFTPQHTNMTHTPTTTKTCPFECWGTAAEMGFVVFGVRDLIPLRLTHLPGTDSFSGLWDNCLSRHVYQTACWPRESRHNPITSNRSLSGAQRWPQSKLASLWVCVRVPVNTVSHSRGIRSLPRVILWRWFNIPVWFVVCHIPLDRSIQGISACWLSCHKSYHFI